MTDMIERVAKAINDTMLNCGDYKPIGLARAAIAAMRDPDHDMTGAVLAPCVDRTSTVRSWNKMIDAALECSTKLYGQ
jgi:hypothetical protein